MGCYRQKPLLKCYPVPRQRPHSGAAWRVRCRSNDSLPAAGTEKPISARRHTGTGVKARTGGEREGQAAGAARVGRSQLPPGCERGRPQPRPVPTEAENSVCLSEKARTQEQRSGLQRGLRRRGWRQAQDGGRGRCSEEALPAAALRPLSRRSPGLPSPPPLLGLLRPPCPSRGVSPGRSRAGQAGVSIVRRYQLTINRQ